ncbi:hypothetical protein QYM36_004195 [Artemia franciscana]|uniref:Phosphoenolpyruvate synthase n=1 Tax=Artemia franciscana TaxID=6661 RepID=A0AA88IE97_ARTSF|nr:hypothetical protein QYM36_004195 [Artemia franciscana]
MGPFYWFKRIYATICLALCKQRIRKSCCLYDSSNDNHGESGILPTEKEWEIEKPRPICTNRCYDQIFVYGSDGKGTSLTVGMSRKLGRQAEVFLMLVLKDGTKYELPGAPDTSVFNTDEDIFSAAGILLEVIEPFRKWRICFNGLLKKTCCNDEERIVHLKLNAIWTAMCRPFDFASEFSPTLLAKAVARERWTNRTETWDDLCKMPWEAFDQWGTIYGTMEENGTHHEAFYLRGLRQRRYGNFNMTTLRRNILLIGQSEEGVFFSLRGTCDTSRLLHEVQGHMYDPSGQVLPITRCDLDLAEIGHYAILPSRFSLRFTGGQNYRFHLSIQKLQLGTEVFRGRPWIKKVQVALCDFTVNSSSGWGIVELTNRYFGECPLPVEDSLSKCVLVPSLNEKVPLALSLDNESAKVVGYTGGKGASLAALQSLQKNISSSDFQVPKGFILTTKSFEQQVNENGNIQSALKTLEEAIQSGRDISLKDEVEKLVATIRNSKMCDLVQKAIQVNLEELFRDGINDVAFAVRSSAVGEDSNLLSAAGQNETFLNCKGIRSIEEAILRCWASAYRLESVEYRRHHGQPIQTSIAVVVQAMIDSDVAGVMFTCDPATGNPAKVFVTANYGLGESVVSGRAEPDTIILSRNHKNELALLDRQVGKKDLKIICDEKGNTKEVEVPLNDRSKDCLDDNIALRVGELGILTEKYFGNPRDNEFAISKGKIFLLQSRPVTHLHNWTDFELTHELDSPVVTSTDIYTKANTGEVFPNATSPLSTTLIAKSLDLAIQSNFVKRFGGSFIVQPQINRFVTVSHHHAMLNVIDTMLSNNEPEISATNRAVDMAVFGHIVTTNEMLQRGIQRFGTLSYFKKLRKMLLIGSDFLVNSWRPKWAEAQLKKINFSTDACEEPQELFTRIRDNLSYLIEVNKYHSLTSEFSTTLQLISFLTLSENKKDWSPELLGKLGQLLSSCTFAESGEVPESIQVIANVIANCAEANEFKSMSPDVAVVWLQTDPGPSGKLFREFLKKHGHRCIREFDIINYTWSMDPRPLVVTLQSIVNNMAVTKENNRHKIEIARNKLLEDLKPGLRRALNFILPMARKGVQIREATKSILIKTVHEFRLVFRKLAKLLVWKGYLVDEDLLFYFTFSEIECFIRSRSPALLLKAQKRKKLRTKWETLVFPEISFGLPMPEKNEEDNVQYDCVESLNATPVCSGKVRGKARVVLDVAQAHLIQKGDILITRSTDIGWSPYFPLLGGVVTELGGLISHGAVVAREYGLPCIVGAAKATSIFNSGKFRISFRQHCIYKRGA